MEDWHFWVPTGISLAAVAFSAASWWHNLSAHHERRSGEIIRLVTDILERLTRVEERLEKADEGLSSVRFNLRTLPESHENKYDWIEEAPALADELKQLIAKATWLRRNIGELSNEHFPSGVLRELQISEHKIIFLERGADKLTQVVEEQTEPLNQHNRREAAEREARDEELMRLARNEPKTLPKT
jgi:hypothetical protein